MKPNWKGEKGDKGHNGKGKNEKGGKKGGGKSKSFNGDQLVAKTPDGRELCFAYNTQGCKGQCGRVHTCRVRGCLQSHPAREHHKYAQGAKGGEDKSTE